MTLLYAAKGYDCYAGALPEGTLEASAKGGAEFVVHYYGGSVSKDLTAASAKATTALGMWVGAVWESAGDQPASFNQESGIANANAAISMARAVGQPPGSAIYFAVDFGAIYAQIAQNVIPYFKSAAPLVRAAGYKIGCYGCGTVLTELWEFGLIDYDWLGGAMGWPGSRGYSYKGQPAALVQGLPGDPYRLGMQVDPDTAFREAGLFQVA